MTKKVPIIGDYIPVLQLMLENYHNADFKTQKMAMELMAHIGHKLNLMQAEELEKEEP